jgi:hypothetical protein
LRFTYKSQAIWDKEVMGMGYWFRDNTSIDYEDDDIIIDKEGGY